MPTWMVTGGAGFVGSTLVRTLLARGEAVVTLDRLSYAGHLRSLDGVLEHPAHTFVQGDVRDRALLAELLRRTRPRYVLNLAAETHVDRSIDGPRAFVDNNVDGALGVLEAALGWWRELPGGERDAFRVLQVSTDEVFGSLGPEGQFTEQSPYAPRSPYAASKAAADHLVCAFQATYGLPTLLAHPCNTYGPRQHPEKLVPLMVLRAAQGQPLPVYGDGEQVRDWVHVEDTARALVLVAEAGSPGQRYLVSAGDTRTNLWMVRELARRVEALRPQAPPAVLQHVADRPGHDRRYASDARRLRQELGWAPQVPLEAGLDQAVAWFLEHSEWVQAVCAGRYAGERLGLGVQAGL